MKSLSKSLTLLAASAFISINAFASTLNYNISGDNSIEAYLSTDGTTFGSAFASSNTWWNTESGNTTVQNGQDYFLLIKVVDDNAEERDPQAFAGDFALTGNHQFSNGTQSLFTNLTDWGVNNTGFGDPYHNPYSLGSNGEVGLVPWSTYKFSVSGTYTMENIDSSAHWIWNTERSDQGYNSDNTAYFMTRITSVPDGGSTLAFLALSISGLSFLGRRYRKTK
tara:strand:- start:279 stop:947 length:669 start_codon:yes stop_codon:yes gene_type:complete